MTSRVLAGIFVLFAASCAQTQTPAVSQDLHFRQGVGLLRQQQFSAALPELLQAERVYPKSAEVANLVGITETQLGHLSEADNEYEKAIRLDPRMAGAHKNLGFNRFNEKNYAAANNELRAALALNPSDPFTHYYLANLFLATSRNALAVEELVPARDLLANDPDNAFLMIKACIETGNITGASSLINLLSDHSQLTLAKNYSLAILFTTRHLYPQATARFEYALSRQPDSWVAKYNLAVSYLNEDQPDKALALLKPLAVEQPANAGVLSALGFAFEVSERLPEALEAYKSAVRADPDNPDRYLDYTRLLMDLDRNEEAMKVVEQGIPVTQDAYALDVRLGVLRSKQGRFDDARTALQQAIDLHPHIVVAYVAFAQTYMQQGEDDKALPPLLKIRAMVPPDAALEYYIGLISLRLGHEDQAEAALKTSVRLQPDASETHYELGKLYFGRAKLQDAKKEFQQAVALAPASSNAYVQLSKIDARLGDPREAAQMAAQARQLIQTQRDKALLQQKDRIGQFQTTSPN